jgi:hypothetical protein
MARAELLDNVQAGNTLLKHDLGCAGLVEAPAPHVLQDISSVTQRGTGPESLMRHGKSRPCPISRSWRG